MERIPRAVRLDSEKTEGEVGVDGVAGGGAAFGGSCLQGLWTGRKNRAEVPRWGWESANSQNTGWG